MYKLNTSNYCYNNKNSITILGCGSSGGVPSVESGWGNCDPNNIKNHRKRSSILVTIDDFNILVDTSPDLRQQALDNSIKEVHCIFYTHGHSDHTAGVDEVRSFNRLMNKSIDCYLNKKTYNKLNTFFKHVIQNTKNLNQKKGYYSASLTPNIIKNNDIIKLNNNKITVKAIEHSHGYIKVMGYKFNNKIAYITDILDFINNKSLSEYKNLDIIIISACVLRQHRSHMTLYKVIDILTNILKPKKAFLTHMSECIDFNTQTNYLKNKGLSNIFLCYDNMKIYI